MATQAEPLLKEAQDRGVLSTKPRPHRPQDSAAPTDTERRTLRTGQGAKEAASALGLSFLTWKSGTLMVRAAPGPRR